MALAAVIHDCTAAPRTRSCALSAMAIYSNSLLVWEVGVLWGVSGQEISRAMWLGHFTVPLSLLSCEVGITKPPQKATVRSLVKDIIVV